VYLLYLSRHRHHVTLCISYNYQDTVITLHCVYRILIKTPSPRYTVYFVYLPRHLSPRYTVYLVYLSRYHHHVTLCISCTYQDTVTTLHCVSCILTKTPLSRYTIYLVYLPRHRHHVTLCISYTYQDTITTLHCISHILIKTVGPNFVVIFSAWKTGYFLSISNVFIRMTWVDANFTNFCGRFICRRFRGINVKELSNAKIGRDRERTLKCKDRNR